MQVLHATDGLLATLCAQALNGTAIIQWLLNGALVEDMQSCMAMGRQWWTGIDPA